MMKTKYLAPICAGLVALAGLGTIVKGMTDVFNHDYEKYPKIKGLMEVQNQRSSLESKFYVKKEETNAKQLFENNRKQLYEFIKLEDEITTLKDKEKELLNNSVIRSEYDSYLQHDFISRRKANNIMLIGSVLLLSGFGYITTKYRGAPGISL
jgi:hypothetical protein